ncbi:MAG: hypothetical protein JWO88_1205 [Frankiales bacterium]|nr:hypothetical protein [Frankiales bacterium]
MRISRISVIVSIALAVSLGGPAQASGRTAPDHVTAPYTSTNTFTSLRCLAGTTCTPTTSAVAGTGRTLSGMDMDRAANDQAGSEDASAFADQYVDVRPPKGTTKATATFSWLVRSTTTTATSEHGEAFASTGLYASALCGSCTATLPSVALVSSSSSAATPATSTASDSLKDTSEVLTVSIDGLPRNAIVRLYSGASAHTDMSALRVCSGVGPCDALPPVDATHSGTVTAAVDAVLTSVDLTYS